MLSEANKRVCLRGICKSCCADNDGGWQKEHRCLYPETRMTSSMPATLLLTLGVYLVLQYQYHAAVYAAPSGSDVVATGGNNLEGPAQRGRGRSFLQTPPRAPQYVRARLVPLEPAADVLNDFVIDDEVIDFNKRLSDDYGHMRFGKREQFDDYGHMRFGRSLD